MFQFRRFPPYPYVFRIRCVSFPTRIAPFGYLRINVYLRLPGAFRSLSRPSSAPDAKAFPLRSFQLDLLAAKSAYLHLHFALGMGVAASARVVREILVLV